MTWANDETGLLVIAGTGKAGKKAKVKTPKPEKAPKPDKKNAASQASRPSMPGLPPVREAPRGTGLLDSRPSVPIGVPIVRAPMRGMTSAGTGVHRQRKSQGHPVLRAFGVLFVVLVIAAGGFAAGALTELGTEAEAFVLGPPPLVAPAKDPRVPVLQAEVTRLQAELDEERKISIDMRPAAAVAADDAAIELGGKAVVADDDKARDRDKKRKHKSRRHRDKRRIDL